MNMRDYKIILISVMGLQNKQNIFRKNDQTSEEKLSALCCDSMH